MGSEYKWSENPVRDSLLQMIILGVDISDKEFLRELYEIISLSVENYVVNKEDLVYLNFKINKSEEHFKLIGNNIITALWFCGILPKNPTHVMEANECHYNGKIYTFDKKTKTLKSTVKK